MLNEKRPGKEFVFDCKPSDIIARMDRDGFSQYDVEDHLVSRNRLRIQMKDQQNDN